MFVGQNGMCAFYSVNGGGNDSAGISCSLAAWINAADVALEKFITQNPYRA